jgi:hypothetical protein
LPEDLESLVAAVPDDRDVQAAPAGDLDGDYTELQHLSVDPLTAGWISV